MHPLVSVHWLATRLGTPDLRLLEVCSNHHKRETDVEIPEQGRIPGAISLDLEHDLSAPIRPNGHGGRHPLPDPNELGRKFGQSGINRDHSVVVYDNALGMFAARAWWLLRYLGHERVALLDGGLQAWQAAGNVLESKPTKHAPTTFEVQLRPELLAEAQDVRDRSTSTMLIDSRAPERFSGAVEPLDTVGGHIPGAINRFWQDSLETWGTFLPPERQRQRFEEALERDEIIVYCGSGVTACVNIIALELAGMKAKLYAGSWSDWISDPQRPVARTTVNSDPNIENIGETK